MDGDVALLSAGLVSKSNESEGVNVQVCSAKVELSPCVFTLAESAESANRLVGAVAKMVMSNLALFHSQEC
jgi:hypothetical protein